jgi:universal stress protein A
MLPFQKILFPVDYSAPCQAVIPYVQEMASHFAAELTVCHAYEPLAAIAHSELLVTDPNLQAKAQALEEDRLHQFACLAFPGQKLETMVALGEPGSVIHRLAQEQRADLVMLATRGHGPLFTGIHHRESVTRHQRGGLDRFGSRTIGASRNNPLSIHCVRIGR